MTPPNAGENGGARDPSGERGPRRMRAVEHPPGNLPLELTSFVGREREVAEVKRLMANDRLLTLTGPGGGGKSRLALAVASESVEEFEDGAWWVGLAPLSAPELVPQVVASVLEVREVPGRSSTEVLAEHLEFEKALLVLDNCEHLVEACATLADALLRACPALRILATSREALSIVGERVWLVPPLSLPDPEHPPPVEELERYEAVRLFVERADAVASRFALSEENAPAVARLCRRLDGMPLAIELAAARARVLSAEQIANRLGDSLRLLATDNRAVLARQQTLQATIGWSHELLPVDEQVLFRRLSVFAGRFGLESAEGICAGRGVEEEEVLDLLSRLVSKSLVIVAEQQGSGEARYRLLETIRQYGAQKLEDSGEAPDVRRRHAGFFVALAEESESAMWGADEAAWLGRLEAEQDNLRAALSWTVERDAELALRLAGALRWFWYWRGHYGGGRRWLEEALTKGRDPVARAKALHAVGWMAHDQADMDRAETVAEEGVELGTTAEIEGSLAASFRNLLGEAARHRGDYRRATQLFEEGTALYQEAGDRRGVAWSLFLRGNAASLQGEHERATALYREGLALCRKLGGAQPLGDHLSHLGYEFLIQGEHERATVLNEEAARLLRDRGYRGGLQFALDNLGWAALVRGDRERAEALHKESLVLCKELGDRLIASRSLEGLACVAGARGEAERATRLFGAAQALREAVGYEQTPGDRALREPHLTTVRARLDEPSLEAAWAGGRALTLEEALEYALTSVPAAAPGRHTQAAPEKEEEEKAPHVELRVFALGQVRVEVGRGRPLSPSDWTYAKSRELLFYLLCHPPRTREQIGVALWPDASPSRLRKAFHNALYHLRKALGRRRWISYEGGRYSFERSPGYFFDVEAFEVNLKEARSLREQDPERAIACLREAVRLYGGEFLEEFLGSEWVLSKQEELGPGYLEALLDLGALLLEEGTYAEAEATCRQAISQDAYSEAAHRQLMRCLARKGERGRAIKHYEGLANLLRKDLDTSPAPESEALYQSLRGGGEV